MRFDDFFRGRQTSPTTRADGQMQLQFGDGGDALGDQHLAHLPIGNGVANADVHGCLTSTDWLASV
jgi:hypothetical protein